MTWRHSWRFATLSLAAGVVASLALFPELLAQTRDDADLEKLKAEISELRSKVQRIRGRANSTEQELAIIDLEVGIRTRELEVAVQQRGDLEELQVIVKAEIERLAAKIQRQKASLGARLAALYRMGEVSYLRILLSIDSEQNPLDAVGTMGYLITRDSRAVTNFRATRDLFEKENDRMAIQRVELEEAHRQVVARQAAVEQARVEKAALLARLRSEQATSTTRLAELEEKAERLERLLEMLYERDEGGFMGQARVEEFKGALGWPVDGEVVEDFGKKRSERFATFTISNGVKIEAPGGSEVRAIFEGTVLYSQWFKGYGNLVIIDHGNRIFSLYGNTRGVSVGAGDRIGAGAAIGLVGEGEDGEASFIYFEMRENNEPVDPLAWLR